MRPHGKMAGCRSVYTAVFSNKACCFGVKQSGNRAKMYPALYFRDSMYGFTADEKCRKKSYFQTEKVRKAAFRELTVVFLMFP